MTRPWSAPALGILGRGLGLSGICVAWLILAGGAGWGVLDGRYGFDALSPSDWGVLIRGYEAGATIPFDFVLLVATWILVALAGVAGLTIRRAEVMALVLSGRSGAMVAAGMDAVRRIRRGVQSPAGRRRGGTAGRTRVPGRARSPGGPATVVRRLLAALSRSAVRFRKARAVATMRPCDPVVDQPRNAPPRNVFPEPVSSPASGPAAAEDRRPAISGDGLQRDRADVRSDVTVSGDPDRPGQMRPAVGSTAREAVAARDAEDGGGTRSGGTETGGTGTDRTAATGDALAWLGRVLTLSEVWIEPAPPWLSEALRDELACWPADGWSLLTMAGDAGARAVAIARSVGPVPEIPPMPSSAGDDASASPVPGEADGGENPLPAEGAEIPDGPLSGPAVEPPPGLTLSASWLTGLLDNYAAWEEASLDGDAGAAIAIGADWRRLEQQTLDQIRRAMRGMVAEDWRSLDRFPDLARRVRILSDRVGERLRASSDRSPGGADRPGTPPMAGGGPSPSLSSSPVPVSPDIPSASVPGPDPVAPPEAAGPGLPPGPPPPGPPSPCPPPPASTGAGLAAIVASAGWQWNAGRPAGPDLLIRKGEACILLCPVSLPSGIWHAGTDLFEDWVSSDGVRMTSPCRAAWRRLSLLRALSAGRGPMAAVVVLAEGRLLRQQGAMDQDPGLTGGRPVHLVRRDAAEDGIDGLAGWLTRRAGRRPDAARITADAPVM